MKKFTLLAAALLMGVSSMFAETIYLKLGDLAWWANDNAKISAIFRDGNTEADAGTFVADFLALAAGETDVYAAEIPEGTYTSVQFLRHDAAATAPGWADFWNGTIVIALESGKNLYTLSNSADDAGVDNRTCSGAWSVYTASAGTDPVTPSTDGKIYLAFEGELGWWLDAGAKFGAIFRVGDTEADAGTFTEWFTLAAGETAIYEAAIPAENAEWGSWGTVQFLRYDPETAGAAPAWGGFWNGTIVAPLESGKNLYTINNANDAAGTDNRTCSGVWSVYGATAVEEVEFGGDINYANNVLSISSDADFSIAIVNLAGTPIVNEVASEFSFEFSVPGVYGVIVNGESFKVLAK